MTKDEIELYIEKMASSPFFGEDYCMMADAHNARKPKMNIKDYKIYFMDKAPSELYPEVLDNLLAYYPIVEEKNMCMHTIFKVYEELCSVPELVGLKTKYMAHIATTLCPTIVIDDNSFDKEDVLAALVLEDLSLHKLQVELDLGYHKAKGILTYLRQRGIIDSGNQRLASTEQIIKWIDFDFKERKE